MERLAWWRLTYPKHLTEYGTRHCSPSSPPSLCLLMSSFLSNRSISAVVDAPSSSFSVNSGVLQGSVLSPTLFLLSLMIFSPAHLTLFTHMPMTRPFILQLISILLPLLPLELPLVLIFPLLFSLIWIKFPDGVVSTL